MTAPSDTGEEPIVVYACVTRGYDAALQPVTPTGGVEFICFTDSPTLKAPGWRLVPFASPERLTSGHDINRFHKIFPHHLFPRHCWSVYVDGHVRFAGEWRQLVEALRRSGAPIGAFTHPDLRSLEEEVAACGRLKKFDAREQQAALRQLDFYRAQGLDLTAPISANGLLVRDHRSAGLGRAMSVWWSQLFEFSKRDQLSLGYALFSQGLDGLRFDQAEGLDASLFSFGRHHQPLGKRLGGRLVRALGRRLKGSGREG